MLQKETAFPRCRASDSCWNKKPVSVGSSVTARPNSCISSPARWFHVPAVSIATGTKTLLLLLLLLLLLSKTSERIIPVPLCLLSVLLEAHVEQLFGRILEAFFTAAAPCTEEVMSQNGMGVTALRGRGKVATPGDSNESSMIPV